MKYKKLSIIIFCAILLEISSIQAEEYHVDKEQENLVKFISDTPIDKFEGLTDNIDGYVYWEGIDSLMESELYFEVQLNDLDTGIGLRNRHMRENYLHTDKYPIAAYKAKLNLVKKLSENVFEVFATGTMSLHGVDKSLKASATVTHNNDLLKVESEFEIKLSDFNIEIPKLMFMKISEIIAIKLNLYMNKFSENRTENN